MKLSFKEALERQDATREKDHREFAFLEVILRKSRDIVRPIDVVNILKSAGVPLKEAHQTLETLAQGHSVEIYVNGKLFPDVSADLLKIGIDVDILIDKKIINY